MKRLFLIVFLFVTTATMLCAASSDDVFISTGETGFATQSWFSSGTGRRLPEDDIKKFWDEGYRITSLSYTTDGWFVVVSKGSKIGMQTYCYNNAWPTEWMSEKWAEGYFVTSVAQGYGGWCVVMSKGLDYGSQTTEYGDMYKVQRFIEENWKKGYRITTACTTDGKWYVVMSRDSGISEQSIVFRSQKKAFLEFIDEKWAQRYMLTLALESKDGVYFGVLSLMANGSSPAQRYSFSPSSAKTVIQEMWGKNMDLTFVGGSPYGDVYAQRTGYCSTVCNTQGQAALASNASSSKPVTTAPANKSGGKTIAKEWRVDEANGYTDYYQYSDGSMKMHKVGECFFCHGSGTCAICHGVGGKYMRYSNIFYPCTGCNQSGKCSYCRGTGRQEFVSVVDARGNAIGVDNSGNTPIVVSGTAGNSAGSSSSSSNRSGSSNTDRYGSYDCPTCYGTGRCQTCGGDGVADATYTTNSVVCPSCGGSGKCPSCHGTGKVHGVK